MRASSAITALLATAAAASSASSPHLVSRGTSGCGKPYDTTNTIFSRSVRSGGVNRSYSVQLPAGYAPEKSHPVILGFHGSESIGVYFEADTRFSEAAGKTNDSVIMIYPDGLGGAWAGASYSKATVPQDLQFVLDLLGDVRAGFCVDDGRIFATGMSIGGGFVDTIACNGTVGKEFAGFAPVAGAFYTDNDENYKDCKPSKPVYMVSFAGGKDASIPYDGGEGSGGKLPAINTWMDRWVDRLDCNKSPMTEQPFQDKSYTWKVWDCHNNGRLAHMDMANRNHSWPSDEPNFSQAIANDKPAPFNAASLILGFFLEPRWRDLDKSPGEALPGYPTSSGGSPAPTSAGETKTETSSTVSHQSTTGSAAGPTPSAGWRVRLDLGLVFLVLVLQLSVSI